MLLFYSAKGWRGMQGNQLWELTPTAKETRLEAIYTLHKKLGVDEYYGQIRNHHFSRIRSS
jgi:hypothetical protein